VLSVRPKVAELVMQLYSRPLHPELFQFYNTRLVERDRYQARISITSAGHIVSWRHQGLALTEVATSAHNPLPQRRRLISNRLRGTGSDRLDCRGGARYQVSFQLETVDPQVFWTFQEELAAEEHGHALVQRFDSSGRIALGAVSYINVEARTRSLLVQTFHTFPDDCAIVKSQSLFEIP
jgi:hypothetical protein